MAENNPGPMAYHPINNSVTNAKGVTFGWSTRAHNTI
jgi:hypothetical protein